MFQPCEADVRLHSWSASLLGRGGTVFAALFSEPTPEAPSIIDERGTAAPAKEAIDRIPSHRFPPAGAAASDCRYIRCWTIATLTTGMPPTLPDIILDAPDASSLAAAAALAQPLRRIGA